MASIRNRAQARQRKQRKQLRKAFSAELADQTKRQKKRIDAAIVATALKLSFAKEDGAVLVRPPDY